MAALHQAADGNWAKAFFACPVERVPGTHFLYNTGATYMLSAIIQHLTGMTLLEYLRPRLLDPLGIEQASWESCPRGINTGGFGLSITTDAITRFGQLYLQKGRWQDQQLVPADWVAAATSSQINNAPNSNIDWAQGYGYQFWRCRHNAYRGDGAFGQYCVVLPEQDAVLAITSGLGDMQPVLDLVWEHLLPAFGPAVLPDNTSAQAHLRQKLASLALPLPVGQASTATAARISGQTYQFAPNQLEIESIRFTFDPSGCTAQIQRAGNQQAVMCGTAEWRVGTSGFSVGTNRFFTRNDSWFVAAAGAWANESTYQIALYYTETPFGMTLTCQFDEAQILLDVAMNVSFGPTTFPQLVGSL
jgi:hypothetical protein